MLYLFIATVIIAVMIVVIIVIVVCAHQRDLFEKYLELSRLTNSLGLEQSKNKIIHLIDYACDMQNTPDEMYNGITRALIDFFQAHYGAFFITDPENGKLKNVTKFVSGITQERLVVTLALLEKWVESLSQENEDPQIAKGEILNCMAINIFLLKKRLGMIVLVRLNKPFSEQEAVLLKEVESIMDTALGRALLIHDYQLEKRANDIRDTVDAINDRRDISLREKWSLIVATIKDFLSAKQGYLLLLNTKDNVLDFATMVGDFSEAARKIIEEKAREALERGSGFFIGQLSEEISSVILQPLRLDGDIIGIVVFTNPVGKEIFNEDDLYILDKACREFDTAVFTGLDLARYTGLLEKRVGPALMKIIRQNPDVNMLEPHEGIITTLDCDVRGFTKLVDSKALSSKELSEFLRDYYQTMTELILKNGGILDKFMGDGVMGLFGAIPSEDDRVDSAVKTGLEMIKSFDKLVQEERWGKRLTHLKLGVGAAKGEALVGEIGCEIQTSFTAIGDSVNLSSRLCGKARPEGLVIDETTFKKVQNLYNTVEETGEVSGKGIVTYYFVSGPKTA